MSCRCGPLIRRRNSRLLPKYSSASIVLFPAVESGDTGQICRAYQSPVAKNPGENHPVRHSSSGGINRQAQRPQSAALPCRRARAHRRPPGQAHRRTPTLELATAQRHPRLSLSRPVRRTLPESLQVPALRELGRVVRPGGLIRLLEYVRPRGTARRILSRLWDPWIAWAYGASFDRQTERHVPAVGLEIVESRYVVDDLVKLLTLRAH